MTRRTLDGRSERRQLETPEAFHAVLRDEFGLELDDAELRDMLQVVERRGTRGAPHPFFA